MTNIHDLQVVHDLADRITQARELLAVDGTPISEEVDRLLGDLRHVLESLFASIAPWPSISAPRVAP
jgi:hypothetical protein